MFYEGFMRVLILFLTSTDDLRIAITQYFILSTRESVLITDLDD